VKLNGNQAEKVQSCPLMARKRIRRDIAAARAPAAAAGRAFRAGLKTPEVTDALEEAHRFRREVPQAQAAAQRAEVLGARLHAGPRGPGDLRFLEKLLARWLEIWCNSPALGLSFPDSKVFFTRRDNTCPES